MANDPRPNIILIMTDQQRGDCLGVDGHPVLQTPNVNALAGGLHSRGTHFARAYSPCPSCIPARRCLLSGQSPQKNGMVGFRSIPEWFPAATLPDQLRRAGYQTCLVGRSMHQNPMRKRYGYEQMVLGSCHQTDDDYAREMLQRGDYPDGFLGHGLDLNSPQARPFPMDESLHPTTWVTNQAVRFLQRRDPTCPFFLTVSFYAPHPPLCPPAFYMDRYLRTGAPAPAIGDWAQAPPERGLREATDSGRVDLHGEALASCLAGYFGLINHIDDQIRRVLFPWGPERYDLNNTLVVFVSDHGEMLGDHHLFRKIHPYEGSARIPLVVWPGPGLGIEGPDRCDAPVALQDIMPTVLEAAGLPIPDTVDGRSLLPLLRGQHTDWRPYLHGEHAAHNGFDQSNHYLTDGRMKYIWRPETNREQLFDLANDPRELHDLTHDTGAADELALWRRRLIDELRDRPEGFVRGGRLAVTAQDRYTGLLPHARGERAPA